MIDLLVEYNIVATMSTRSGTSARRRREAASGTVKLLERRTAALEVKEELTVADRQSALRMSKLLGDVSADFKSYHFAIVEQLENEDDLKAEQENLDRHELQVMELIDRLGQLMEVPSQAKPVAGVDLLQKHVDHLERQYRVVGAPVAILGICRNC